LLVYRNCPKITYNIITKFVGKNYKKSKQFKRNTILGSCRKIIAPKIPPFRKWGKLNLGKF
jgi:hypothetical protein